MTTQILSPDALNTEAENILRVAKIEVDRRDENNNTRRQVVEIEQFKKYALIEKKGGQVVKIVYAQNTLSLLLKHF